MVVVLSVCNIIAAVNIPVINQQSHPYYQRHGSGMYFGIWNIGQCWHYHCCYGCIKVYLGKSVHRLVCLCIRTVVPHISSRHGALNISTGQHKQDRQYNLAMHPVGAYGVIPYCAVGIRQKNKYCITAIAAFHVTLLKLFLHDLAGMSTPTKPFRLFPIGRYPVGSFICTTGKEILFGSATENDGT